MRCALLWVACALSVRAQKPFDVHAMLGISRISEPQLSPDGKVVAFTVQTIDVEKNTKPRQISCSIGARPYCLGSMPG